MYIIDLPTNNTQNIYYQSNNNNTNYKNTTDASRMR